jgi:hypothetical protein
MDADVVFGQLHVEGLVDHGGLADRQVADDLVALFGLSNVFKKHCS